MIKSLAFWAPSLLGAVLQPKFGAAVSPSEVVLRGGAKVPFVGDVAAEARIPRAGAAPPPAPPAQMEEPIPYANAWEAAKGKSVQPPPPLDQATQALIKHAADSQAAERMAQGLPPTPPPPPQPKVSDSLLAPTSVKQGRIAPEDIAKFARAVAPLPAEVRAKAIQEAHQTLSKVLLEQGQRGSVIGPDGKIELIKNPEQADSVAQRIINSAIDQVEKTLAGKQPPTAKPSAEETGAKSAAPAPSVAPTSAPGRSRAKAQELAQRKTGKFSAADLSEPQQEVITPGTGKFSLHDLTDEIQPSVPTVGRAPVPEKAASVGRNPVEAGEGGLPEQATPRAGGGVQESLGHAAERNRESVGEPGGSLAKGGQVALTRDIDVYGEKLPAGTRITVKAHLANGIVRGVVTDGPFKGRKISRGVSAFQSVNDQRNISTGGGSVPQVAAAQRQPELERTPTGESVSIPASKPATEVTPSGRPLATEKEIQKPSTAKPEPISSWQPPAELGAFPERQDVGKKARNENPEPTRAEVKERRSVNREGQQAEDKLFSQARKELGENATTEQVVAKVAELRPTQKAAEVTQPAKSDWQQAYGKAIAKHPERESEFRKMSGEQLKAVAEAKSVTGEMLSPKGEVGTTVPEKSTSITNGQFSSEDLEGAPPPAKTPEVIESGRYKILESEIKHLKEQARKVSEEFSLQSLKGYDPHSPLRAKYNELLTQAQKKEDELAHLRGEPTRSEKREMQKEEAAKKFADRPKAALAYDNPKQSQHWQVLEPDYIEKRFADKVKQYERAIPEKQAEVDGLKAGTVKHTTAEANLKYWKDILAKAKEHDPRQAQTFKNEYIDLVKKAVSHGSPVPDAVIAQHPEFKLAQDARERYEKGRHTSFANKSIAVNDTMRKDEGFKVKRQDGKPITEEQIKEISKGVDDITDVLGPELRDMLRGTDLTISHTNGKHPFLSDAGGMYHPMDRTISAGINDFLGRPVRALAHELGHWLDYESGRVLNTKALINLKGGGPSKETRYVSEADRNTKPLYELARRTMSDTRQAEKMVKTVKLADLPDDERAQIERMKVVLGPYWHEPRELWARMFEQYIASKLGRPSLAAESTERYQNMPAWWTSAAWEKIAPLFEEALKTRMDAMRDRYAPKAEEVAAPESKPVVATKPEAAKEEPTKAEKVFAADLNKKVGDLRKQIKEVEKEVSAPAAYFQDSAKNASERLKRSARNQKLSDLKSELHEIEQAHKIDLAEKLTPEETVPEAGKNFEGRYVRGSLEPVKAAWLDKYKQAADDTDTPEEHWKWLVKNGGSADKPADFSKGHLYIKVPDDGSFYIPNTPAAIDHALKAAGKFDSSKVGEALPKGGPKKFRMTSPKEFDNAKYIAGLNKEIIELENDLDSAQPLKKPYIEEQLKAARENLAEAKKVEEPEPVLAGRSGERGSSTLAANPLVMAGEAAVRGAGALGEFIRNEHALISKSRDIQREFYNLEPKFGAAVLRAIPVMQQVEKSLGKDAKTIKEGVYHHLEDPERVPLNDKQDDLLDDVVIPIMEQNDKLAEELKGEGFENSRIEGYVHRVVKGKGGWLDRIVSGAKRAGRLNPLSTSAPQLKGRVMMALEKKGDRLSPARMVVSLKGGQVTAWKDGKPTNLGTITNARDGRFWTDKDGNEWKLTQATTKEIEGNTDLVYFHDPVASAIVSNLQLTRAVMAARTIDAILKDPDFTTFGFKAEEGVNPPQDWQRSELGQVVPSLRDYYWEPHVREVLDWQAGRMKQEAGLKVLDNVDRIFRLMMLVNAAAHPLNVMGSWAFEKGIQGVAPWRLARTAKTGIRAIRAVATQNQDYLKMLDAGGPLQSWRKGMGDITKLFFRSLSDDIEAKDAAAIRLAKLVGFIDPKTDKISLPVFQQLHSFSSKAAWLSSDAFFMQSVYEKMDRFPQMSVEDAIAETSRYIPDYRLPTRMFDSKAIADLVSNRKLSYFAAYHYSLLNSFSENAQSMAGLHEPPSGGGSKAQEAAESWGRAAMLYLIPLVLMPLLADAVLKKVTGNEKAKMRRPGPFGVIDNLAMVAHHQKTPVDALTSVVTPNPVTQAGVEIAFNRNLRTGREIYDPSAHLGDEASQLGNFLLDSVPNVGEIHQDYGNTERLKKFAWRQAQVSFPATAAEKMAAEIAGARAPTKAWTSRERDSYYARQKALDALRKGDPSVLQEEERERKITQEQAKTLRHEAHLTPLQQKVHNFSYSELKQVYDVASPEEKKQLDPIKRAKIANLFNKSRGTAANQ
jgi:hypothetical protein